ncbi:lactate permease LctP family transporter [uncultured Desulfovibrio sp.]|uniref:L-lactate permease n=1 Tax=uncultured Desulfovibrio sp. TaxID=167968 RepID=UPI002621A784|nr:lactate permease LctP family transporter [uncultured Desulfovibrio sp.]
MTWTQVYNPAGGALFSALLAGIPLIALFYMLAVRRAKGHYAAAAAVALSFALAIFVWGMPAGTAVSSFIYGAAFGLFPIVWIVVTAVWVYNMTVESGEFEYLKQSLARLTDDRRLQAIFIAFAFGSFIEGTAGFGTPVAITAAMLVGLGFQPLYAAGICLIANTAPVAFGAIGVPVIVAGQVSGFSDMTISAIVGRQLPFLSVIVPFWLCVVMCGFKRSLEVLPAIIVAGVCFAGSQFVFSNFHGPTLPDIMSAIVAIIGLVVLLRVWKPARVWRFDGETAVAEGGAAPSVGVVLRAWGPYIILAVMVFLWGLPQFKSMLNAVPGAVITFGWPGVDGMVHKAAPILAAGKDPNYAAQFTFNWLSAGGTAILLAGFFSVPLMPGYSFGKAVSCFFRTVYQLRFPILTIAMILGLAYLMNYSGMSSTLGIAFTMTGGFFPLFAPLLGWLGVFLTGSDTSSNALFCGMQRSTAEVVGMYPELAVAANSSGGVTGKMISPQSISVATAATNMVGQEGNLFRFALPHSLAMTVCICVLTWLQAGPLRWMLP